MNSRNRRDRASAQPVVFLDFDGVLHGMDPVNSPELEFLEEFCAVLREHPHAQIVISSSWRSDYPLATLREFFPLDIAARIVDTTPASRGGNWSREYEIRTFLHTRRWQHHPWIALDDMRLLFRSHEQVIFCDPMRGLTSDRLAALSVWLEAPPAPTPEPKDAAWREFTKVVRVRAPVASEPTMRSALSDDEYSA